MVTPDVGVQGTWRTPAAGRLSGREESSWAVPGPQIDVFGPEITHPTAASAGVRMEKASLICVMEPTSVQSSKYQRFQMSVEPVVGFAWCASARLNETFSMACWIPMAKKRGPSGSTCGTPCALVIECSTHRSNVG
jgi:hypothetical protein